MRKGVIKHSGARTRALYKWENEVLLQTPPGFNTCDEVHLNCLAEAIWASEGWDLARPAPRIHLLDGKKEQYSWSMGKKHVYLIPPIPAAKSLGIRLGGNNPVVLIHELTHARGFGDYGPMHSVGFVKLYLRLLSKYLGWDLSELVKDAKERGLL